MPKFTVEYLLSLPAKEPLRDRILRLTERMDSGCWHFTGATDLCGYGRIKVGKHNLGAHKVAYLMLVGDYDQDNLELLHSCDNPICVNPAHLKPATHRENIQDCVLKGRHPWSDNRPSNRKEAQLVGADVYLGKVCAIHGTNTRRTKNGECVECYEDHKTKLRERNRSK